MPELNPYEPPKCSSMQEVGAWRDGLTLVMTRDAWLPDLCIGCGVPSTKRCGIILLAWERGLVHRLRHLLMPTVSLCRGCRLRWLVALCLGLIVAVADIGLLVFAVSLDGMFNSVSPTIGELDCSVAICSLCLVIVTCDVFYVFWAGSFALVRRRDGPFVWLGGVNSTLLAALPQFKGTESEMHLDNGIRGAQR